MTGDTIATAAFTTGNETYEARKEKLYLLSSSRLLAVRERMNWTQGSDRAERSKRSALARLGQSMGMHGPQLRRGGSISEAESPFKAE